MQPAIVHSLRPLLLFCNLLGGEKEICLQNLVDLKFWAYLPSKLEFNANYKKACSKCKEKSAKSFHIKEK
jgi:hypothetical protein